MQGLRKAFGWSLHYSLTQEYGKRSHGCGWGGDGHLPSSSSSRGDKTWTPAHVPMLYCRELTWRSSSQYQPPGRLALLPGLLSRPGAPFTPLPPQVKSSQLQAEISEGQKRARLRALTSNTIELLCQERLKNVSQSYRASSSLFSATDLQEETAGKTLQPSS